MDNINIPSYNSLIPNDRKIRSIQDLYDYISRWKKEVDEHNDANNLSAIMSLAIDSGSGLTIDITNAEYKIAWIDGQSNVVFGKKQDNTWYFSDTLDNILDTIISNL